jgi:hypothetical protein
MTVRRFFSPLYRECCAGSRTDKGGEFGDWSIRLLVRICTTRHAPSLQRGWSYTCPPSSARALLLYAHPFCFFVCVERRRTNAVVLRGGGNTRRSLNFYAGVATGRGYCSRDRRSLTEAMTVNARPTGSGASDGALPRCHRSQPREMWRSRRSHGRPRKVESLAANGGGFHGRKENETE